ncbi:MAG: chemotaxis protein CheA [bacterium]
MSNTQIDEFLGEAEDIIDSLNADLLSIHESYSANRKTDPSLINNIFRAAHSLKGISGLFGFSDLTDLSHTLENLLDKLRMDKIELNEELFDLLFESVDMLRSVVYGKAEDVEPPALEEVEDLTRRLVEAESGESGGEAADDLSCVGQEILSVLTEYEEHRLQANIKDGLNIIKFRAAFELSTFDEDLSDLQELAKSQGEVITTLPSAGDSGDDKITFDIIVGADKPLDTIEESLAGRPVTMEVLRKGKAPQAPSKEKETEQPAAKKPPDEKEAPELEAPLPEQQEQDSSSLRTMSQTVRVDIGKLDNLMNIVGELVIAKNSLSQLIEKLRDKLGFNELVMELIKNSRTMERKLSDLQSGVLEVRMVPIGQTFDKLHRNVRKLSRELDKEVDFKAEGGDTELDKLIIEDLADPLMHLIRNCMDHGIEAKAERVKAGKPERGSVRLSAYQKGNHVVIDVQDDGRGLDYENIQNKAAMMGLLDPEAEYRPEELVECLFSPGFSTMESVSEYSGRGVGLDVVKSNISSLSGAIDVDSTPGKGIKFSITIPMTLAIIQALIVEAGGETFAIPLNSVQQGLMIKPEDIQTIENREVIELRGKTVPLLRLNQLFGLREKQADNGPDHLPDEMQKLELESGASPAPPGLSEMAESEDEDIVYVVKVGIAERGLGIIVDKLWGRQDIVIKSVGEILRGVRGIAGATELGNQRTILVLDVVDLMEEAAVSLFSMSA